MTYVVAIYMTDRAYGGHEEGGWWYNTGELIRTIKTFHSEKTATEYCQKFNKRLDKTLNRGRREISSVLSTGRYAAETWNDYAPEYYPEQRPYYE